MAKNDVSTVNLLVDGHKEQRWFLFYLSIGSIQQLATRLQLRSFHLLTSLRSIGWTWMASSLSLKVNPIFEEIHSGIQQFTLDLSVIQLFGKTITKIEHISNN